MTIERDEDKFIHIYIYIYNMTIYIRQTVINSHEKTITFLKVKA
jgi:hypothetical protein